MSDSKHAGKNRRFAAHVLCLVWNLWTVLSVSVRNARKSLINSHGCLSSSLWYKRCSELLFSLTLCESTFSYIMPAAGSVIFVNEN